MSVTTDVTRPLAALAACAALLAACSDDGSAGADATHPDTLANIDAADGVDAADSLTPLPPDRAPGERIARTARCDDVEPARCLVPWPSNAFVAADAASATGLRLAVDPAELRPDDPAAALNAADGFSRLTPIVTALPADVDEASARASVRVFVAEPGPRRGEELPTHHAFFPAEEGDDVATLVTYSRRPLPADSEHLVVVSGAKTAAGEAVPPSRLTAIALGDVAPETDAERARYAYHAPARDLIAELGLDTAAISRVWDFTTRSEDDPLQLLRDLRDAAVAAVDANATTLTITSVDVRDNADIAAIVRGRLGGLTDGAEAWDAPFRVVIPAGDGDYRVVMYAHGAGGDVGDSSFDRLIGGYGAAKVGLEIDGWTDDTLPSTISSLLVPLEGTRALVRRMARSLAGGAAVLRALDGSLGDLLAADTLDGQDNPAAGRRPDPAVPIWAGGSLGGVTGMVFGHLEPRVAGGILNVPGAGFTHWLPSSGFYDILATGLAQRYTTAVDLQVAVSMTQQLWDAADGAAWAGTRDEAPIFVVQISVGDPIMPNIASEVVAQSLEAVYVGTPIAPIPGLPVADEARGVSGVTQYLAPGDKPTHIHGFAARDTEAGRAARQQFIDFIETLWAGEPVITVPAACDAREPAGVCDFVTGTDE